MTTHNATPAASPEDQRIEAVMRLADAYATSGSPIYDLSSAARNALRAAIASQLADAQHIIDRLERERDEARILTDYLEARKVETINEQAMAIEQLGAELAALKSAQPADVARDADIRRAALEEAAKVCEGMRDLPEAKRAQKAADEAISRDDKDDMLHRLRHCSTVSLFNGALERAAKAIRALVTKGAEG